MPPVPATEEDRRENRADASREEVPQPVVVQFVPGEQVEEVKKVVAQEEESKVVFVPAPAEPELKEEQRAPLPGHNLDGPEAKGEEENNPSSLNAKLDPEPRKEHNCTQSVVKQGSFFQALGDERILTDPDLSPKPEFIAAPEEKRSAPEPAPSLFSPAKAESEEVKPDVSLPPMPPPAAGIDLGVASKDVANLDKPSVSDTKLMKIPVETLDRSSPVDSGSHPPPLQSPPDGQLNYPSNNNASRNSGSANQENTPASKPSEVKIEDIQLQENLSDMMQADDGPGDEGALSRSVRDVSVQASTYVELRVADAHQRKLWEKPRTDERGGPAAGDEQDSFRGHDVGRGNRHPTCGQRRSRA